jgi:hypothetical protein
VGCRASNRDDTLKAQRGYTGKSYVRLDGSEVLYGADWERRKLELWERAGGQCEQKTSFRHRCKSPADDPHHIKQRSKGRDDRIENLLALCRFHHNQLDRRKPKWSKPCTSA